MTHTRRSSVALITGVATSLVLVGCSGSPPEQDADGDGPTVAVAAYPLAYIASHVVGDDGAVEDLAPAGTEPHDIELSPADVARLTSADVVLTIGGFQAAVDDALAQSQDDQQVVDADDAVQMLTTDHEGAEEGEGSEHQHDEIDPHMWLDPMRVATLGDALAQTLGQVDPDHAEDFTANAADLRSQMTSLDSEMRGGLAPCAGDSIFTSHEAFGYLADAYGLHQTGIAGIDPEAEPSPARVAEVLRAAREDGVQIIFTEPGGLTSGADAVAAELGVRLAVLDPIELQPEGTDYRGVMESDLAALRSGLGCE